MIRSTIAAHPGPTVVAASTDFQTYARGDRLSAGDQAGRIGRVETGLLALLTRDAHGRETVVELRGAGALLAESTLLGIAPLETGFTYEALLPSTVVWIDANRAGSASTSATTSTTASHTVQAVLTVVAARTRCQGELASRRQTQTLAHRVAEALLDVHSTAAHTGGAPAVAYVSRTDLARIAGGNRPSVSGICTQFEDRGWCARLGTREAQVDAPALRTYLGRGGRDLVADFSHQLLRHQQRLWELVTGVRAPAAVAC